MHLYVKTGMNVNVAAKVGEDLEAAHKMLCEWSTDAQWYAEQAPPVMPYINQVRAVVNQHLLNAHIQEHCRVVLQTLAGEYVCIYLDTFKEFITPEGGEDGNTIFIKSNTMRRS